MQNTRAIGYLLPLAWLLLINLIGAFTWGYGKQTFVVMMLVLAALTLAWRLPALNPTRNARARLIIASLGVVLAISVPACRTLQRDMAAPNGGPAIDIAVNTYLAGTHFLAGRNPYNHFCLVRHQVKPEPGNHVEQTSRGLTMFGVPYHYGFPYFPAMFLSYLPFRALADGYHALRVGNLFFLLLNCLGMGLIAWRHSAPSKHYVAAAMACALYLGVRVLPEELSTFAITDLVIATYATFAYLALSHQQIVLTGVLLGLAQASKLLPGPFLLLPALLFLTDRRGRIKLLAAYLGAATLVLAPFVALDPWAFFSSTILYYLTHHAAGDDTSLWFFLPKALQPIWLVLGYLLSVSPLLLMRCHVRDRLPLALGVAFASHFIFIAFAKMTHLNYIWSIYPLGCMALSTLVCRQNDAEPT